MTRSAVTTPEPDEQLRSASQTPDRLRADLVRSDVSAIAGSAASNANLRGLPWWPQPSRLGRAAAEFSLNPPIEWLNHTIDIGISERDE